MQQLNQVSEKELLWIQHQLFKARLLDSELDLDGIYGRKTAAAFAKFKKLNYLEYPNLYGATTKEALAEVAQINRPTPEDVEEPKYQPLIKLPNGMGILKAKDKVPGCQHFTWGEFTKGGSRIPNSKSVVDGIIKIASALEDVRHRLGDRSITISSGYRPVDINKSVGGVDNSRHIIGDAVDFVVSGIPPLEAYKMVNQFWGNRGGLGWSSQFTHADCRGYQARWKYGR